MAAVKNRHPVRDTILARRSTRTGFVAREVDVALIEDIIRCGLAAPSSKNGEPWRFHVVTDRSLLCAIADAMESAEEIDTYVPHDPTTGAPHRDLVSSVAESAQVLRDVPLGIIIENRAPFSGGRDVLLAAEPVARKRGIFGYALEFAGLGAALQNLWLAAIEAGLVGTFMGDIAIAERWIQEQLGLDGELLGVLALGYGSTPPNAPRQSRDPRERSLVRWFPPTNGSASGSS